MVHKSYHLKRSRLSITFQLCIGLMMSIMLYSLLSVGVWFVALGLLGLSFWLFQRLPRVESLELLDHQQWSLKFHNTDQVERVYFSHWIDHSLYIVIYFSGSEVHNIVIWRDQLDLKYWKSLKVHANLT